MGAISSLSTASRTLKRNGVLFAAAFVVMLINAVPSGFSAVLPPTEAGILSFLLSGVSLVVMPFLMGGLLSMAYEGLDGVTRFETFVEGGKDNYLRLLGAMVLFAVLFGAVATIVALGTAVVFVFVLGMNAAGAGGSVVAPSAGLAVIALVGLLGVLAVALPMFFFQFYAPAVVVSDLGVVASFKRSAALVRRNLVSTLGYTAIAIAVGLVAGVAALGVSMVAGLGSYGTTGLSSPEFGVGVVAGIIVVSAVVSTVVSAFGPVYQVAFYDDRLESLD